MHKNYNEPIICAPTEPDLQTSGQKSDHSVPVAYPKTSAQIIKREYRTRKFRPIAESGIRSFGKWITSENWSSILENITPSDCVNTFEKIMFSKIEENLPLKEVRYSVLDKPWMTKELFALSRKKKKRICQKR